MGAAGGSRSRHRSPASRALESHPAWTIRKRTNVSPGTEMRIGIIARAYDEKGGIGVYTRNIIAELLRIDGSSRYFLYYKNASLVGTFAGRENVVERFVPGANKLWWDQVSIPRAASRDGVDLLFHPKFTIPIFSSAKRVMVVHGADWFLPEFADVYNRLDVMYIRMAMPMYFKACTKVLSVSNYSTNEFARAMPQFRDRLVTTYFGPHAAFKPIDDREKLEDVRRRYNLPERFILSVIRYDPGTPNTRKNAGNMLRAYARLRKDYGIPHKYVVVGRDCERFGAEHRISELGIADDVSFPGLVRQEDLPAFYNLASLYLYPTIIEAFPIPITEAMSCGTPIVTSYGTGLEELAGDAALKVDPREPAEIAAAAHRVLTDPALAQTLRARGLERARMFSWERCARQTLGVFKSVVGAQQHG
jgi:glycosyltransferase involved in cell wall biosynthesis